MGHTSTRWLSELKRLTPALAVSTPPVKLRSLEIMGQIKILWIDWKQMSKHEVSGCSSFKFHSYADCLQKRQSHVAYLPLSSCINSLHPHIYKPGGDCSLDSYWSPTAVNSVIVFGLWASPLSVSGCRWCHTRGAEGWERAHQQLWNSESSHRTQTYPDTTPLWGWSASLGREEGRGRTKPVIRSVRSLECAIVRLSFCG